jgi:hypothetical protein
VGEVLAAPPPVAVVLEAMVKAPRVADDDAHSRSYFACAALAVAAAMYSPIRSRM